MKENLNKSNTGASNQAKANYRKSEVKRLVSEGVSISKAAKMLGIKYSLAKTYLDFNNRARDSPFCGVIKPLPDEEKYWTPKESE